MITMFDVFQTFCLDRNSFPVDSLTKYFSAEAGLSRCFDTLSWFVIIYFHQH